MKLGGEKNYVFILTNLSVTLVVPSVTVGSNKPEKGTVDFSRLPVTIRKLRTLALAGLNPLNSRVKNYVLIN